jgi:hypothetical protein
MIGGRGRLVVDEGCFRGIIVSEFLHMHNTGFNWEVNAVELSFAMDIIT